MAHAKHAMKVRDEREGRDNGCKLSHSAEAKKKGSIWPILIVPLQNLCCLRVLWILEPSKFRNLRLFHNSLSHVSLSSSHIIPSLLTHHNHTPTFLTFIFLLS